MTAPPLLITCTPGVRSGKPCVADFPDLQPEHIQAVLRVALQASQSISD